MKKKPKDDESQLEWPEFKPQVIIPTVMIPQRDGSYLVKPGKPEVIGEETDVKRAAKLTGLSVRRIQAMCESGEIQCRQPSGPKGKYFIPLSEIERMRGEPGAE